jgi:hypothetical protein
MILTRPFRLLVLVLCVLALPASSALAGKKRAPAPSVSSLAPLALHVGDTLTIRGHNFLPGRKRDSVTFKRDGSPAVTVKAAEATRTRMKVVVPAKLARYLAPGGGAAKPSRFRVRVVAGRSSSSGYTALKRSPLIVPAGDAAAAPTDQLDGLDAGCDTSGVIEGVEGDDGTIDSDVLDAAPVPATDPCSSDGEGDDPGADGE